MEAPLLTLYSDAFWISPWVFTVFVALREKGVRFQVKEVGLHENEQHQNEYRAATLTARVPALDDAGFCLAESLAIVEYLEEKFPDAARLWPAKIEDRARARHLSSWIRSKVTWPISDERPTHTMFYERAKWPLSEEGKAAVDKLYEVADRVVSETHPCLFEAWCITDAELAFLLQRLMLNGEAVPKKLKDYASRQWERPSVREWIEHSRLPYVPY